MTYTRPANAAKRLVATLPAPWDLRAMELMRWVAKPQVRATRQRTAGIIEALGSPQVVQTGPFAGMRYLDRQLSSQGGTLPKLIGTYEMEVADAVSGAIEKGHDLLVNIGAAEGYYAVGFAVFSPATRVVCFEMEKPYHTAIRELARLNRVEDRIDIRGACTVENLEASLRSAGVPLVVCDCEGAENELLDPTAVPSLLHSDVLVEVHEMYRPGVSARLQDRFSWTHSIEVLTARARTRADFAAGGHLNDADFQFAMDEGRDGSTQWYYMVPK